MHNKFRNSIFFINLKSYFFFLLLIFSLQIKGQISVDIEPEFEEEITQEQLLEETQPNPQEVRQVSFSDIEKKYNSSDFNYQEEQRTEITPFFRKVIHFLIDLFDFSPGYDGKKIQNWLYFLVFVVALFVGVRLIMRHQGRWFSDRSNKKLEISAEEAEKHIHLADFQSLIQQSEKQNDIRQSIRLYYLWLLKSLSDSNQIQWAVEKTNTDYQQEIKDPNLKNSFAKLSYLYNYVWYGEFPIQNIDYQRAKIDFETHINFKKQKI